MFFHHRSVEGVMARQRKRRERRYADPAENDARLRESKRLRGDALPLLVKRQSGRCALCSRPLVEGERVEVHHHLARALGGGSELANLRAVHPLCNGRAGARPPKLEGQRELFERALS